MASGPSSRLMTLASTTWSRLTSGVFGRGAISFLFATAGVNASNFLFHVLVSRLLGPSQYGIAGALLNVISLVAVPLGALQLYITHHVATHGGQFHDDRLRRTLRATLTAAGIATFVVAALSPIFDNYLHTSSPLPMMLIALWIPFAAASAILQGVLIGKFEFRSVAWITFVGGGPLRLLCGALLVEFGLGVSGAILATLGGQVFTTLGLWIAVKRRQNSHLHGDQVAAPKNLWLSISALSGFTALTGIDSFLARHYFLAHTAGLYVAGAVAAHIALFAPGAIATIAFPHLAQASDTTGKSRHSFYQALLAVTVIEVLVCAVLMLFSHTTIDVLFGSKFLGATTLLGPLALASGLLGIAGLFIYFHLAQSSKVSSAGWIGVVVLTTLVVVNHHSILAVAWSVVVASVVTLVILMFGAAKLIMTTTPFRGELFEYHDFAPATLDLTIVTPFYNPGQRLQEHVTDLIDVLSRLDVTFEIIAVSDGATDGSDQLLESMASDGLRLVRLPINTGKGAALRVGLLQGRGRYIAFIDADGDIPASLIEQYVRVMNDQNPDILYGSKRHPDSNVVYPWVRRLYSVAYQQLTSVLFQISVRDTQTGLKIMRRDVVAKVLPRMLEKRFAFDLELFVVAKTVGAANFVELPVTICERFTSTVSVRSAYRLVLDTLAIFYRFRVLHYYDEVGATRQDIVSTTKRLDATRFWDGDRSLRILIFNWRDLAHPRAGGAEVFTHRVAESWVALGHSVTLFCAEVEGRPLRESVNGINIVRSGGRHSVYREARKFWKSEGSGNFDFVIDEVNTRPFQAIKWANETVVVGLIYQVCRELWFYQLPFPVAFIGRFLIEPWWLRSFREAKVLTISHSSAESLRAYGLKNIEIIPVGADLGNAIPKSPKEDDPTIIFVGRLENHKRPMDVVNAFLLLLNKYPTAKLWIVGSGKLENKLKSVSSEFSDSVKIFGSISDSEKVSRMSRAHVLVATSVREGWGLIVTESASVGTPAIAYDVPGLRDSVKAAKGILVPDNPKDLAVALISYFDHEKVESIDTSDLGVRNWNDVATSILNTAFQRSSYLDSFN